MDSRAPAGGRTVRGPSFDPADLTVEDVTFRGDFDCDEVEVTSGDFTGVRGGGSLVRSSVRKADLSGSRFAPLELSDVRFADVDLSNASWQSVRANRTEVLRGRAIGLRLSLDRADDVYLDGCRLDYAAIHVERVRGTLLFAECRFREATITGDLSNVVFHECSLDGAGFEVNKAVDCDLRTSDLLGARGVSRLRGAWITLEQATSVAPSLAAESGLSVES